MIEREDRPGAGAVVVHQRRAERNLPLVQRNGGRRVRVVREGGVIEAVQVPSLRPRSGALANRATRP